MFQNMMMAALAPLLLGLHDHERDVDDEDAPQVSLPHQFDRLMHRDVGRGGDRLSQRQTRDCFRLHVTKESHELCSLPAGAD